MDWETGGGSFDGLELRQVGGVSRLVGRFPYGRLATIQDRGRVRKERFAPRAFDYALEDDREVNLLVGHSFDRPLASRSTGSLRLADSDDGLAFEADLPAAGDRPSYMVDALLMLENRLLTGISPGFRIPPNDVVPGAVRFENEPGSDGVQIRVIEQAVLVELSVVTRPAYSETEVMMREALQNQRARNRGRRLWL